MDSRRQRLFARKLALPGWLLVFYSLLSFGSTAQSVIGWAAWLHSTPFWRGATAYAANRTFSLVVFILGVLWLTALAFAPERAEADDGAAVAQEENPRPQQPAPAENAAPTIEYVAVHSRQAVVRYEEDGFRLHTTEGAQYVESAVTVSFRHRGGPHAVLIAHLTLTHRGNAAHINYGSWIDENTQVALMSRGDTRELVLASFDRTTASYYVPDDRREAAGLGAIARIAIPDGRCRVGLELDVSEDRDDASINALTFEFELTVDRANGATIRRV